MRTGFSLSVFIPLLLTALISMSCAGTELPTIPSATDNISNTSGNTHTCLGLWQFRIDPDNDTVEFMPLRVEQIHMNGLAYMEPPAGVSLAIDQVVDITPGEVTVDIAISHPYPGMNFAAAFDVCGILITHGSMYFPYSEDLLFPDEGDLRLLNPDGYIRWWNPVEFPPNASRPQFGYIDGLLGKRHDEFNFTATLNGYKYFASDLDDPEKPLSELDTSMRGALLPGTTSIRRYQIAFTPGNLVFNYAVDANWAPAESSGPPIVIPDDFPFSANRPEPYRLELKNIENTLAWNTSAAMAEGALALSVYVYDWHDAGDDMVCAFPQNDELMGMCNPTPVEVGDGYSVYKFRLIPMMMDSADDIRIWFGGECKETGYQDILPFEFQGMYIQEWFEVEEK